MDTASRVALLRWYALAGVDEAIEDMPIDRLKPPPVTVSPSILLPTLYRPEPDVAMPRFAARPPVAPSQSITDARAAADKAKTLDQLREAVLAFEGCALKRTATNTVFADGNPASGLMVIGEAPGAEEDARGIPFCGASGKLLDLMFAAAGYTRERFYITNTLFWRPPGNRPPTPEELAICEPFLQKHIAVVKPKLLVLVGATAVKSVLTSTAGITKMRGKEYSYSNPYLRDASIPVRITFHPSYLLRQPAQKKGAWEDMQVIAHRMKELQRGA